MERTQRPDHAAIRRTRPTFVRARYRARRALAALACMARLFGADPAEAVAQRTGDFELEMDAPWRMEPRGTNRAYGAIPIQVSIHDADQPRTSNDRMLQQVMSVMQGYPAMQVIFAFLEGPIDSLLGPADEILSWFGVDVVPHGELPPVVTLETFESLGIDEEIDGQFVRRRTFTLADIHEVERTVGLWTHSAAHWGPEAGVAPPTRPTHSLFRRWQGQNCSSFAPLRGTSEWHLTAFYTPSSSTPGRNVRLRTVLRLRTRHDGIASIQNHQRFLTVHLAEQPLPKFGPEWAYGDLHYHSQGTDNDGESAYSYRGTVQAMNAMGLDFAFATDHASNSRQIGSARPDFSDELVVPLLRGLRDMSPDRFAFGIDLLNGPSGANRQVTSHPRLNGVGSELAAAQLFLGAEVDVAPETLPGETSSARFCYNVPKILKALDQQTFWPDDFWCDSMSVPQADGRELLLDVQGPNAGSLLSTDFYARQHLIHLPVDGQRKSAFIASNTSKYGGGTRRLGEILDVELGQRQKGYAFLAHPFADGRGDSVGALGPDLISYTSAQLNDAFDSPYILGLQIWNENSLSSADASDSDPFPAPYWEDQHQPFRFRDFQKWDILQLRGLDKSRTSSLSWLPAGQPRRIFAAGGSDAHGDFNYRREGYFFGTDSVNDTAIGKPRNLVQVGLAEGTPISTTSGTARPVSQTQVLDGLKSGNFTITDGPAVRVLVDVNKNGVIDASDVPMGGIHTQTFEGPFQVIVEWKSTPEFAPVEEIDLMLGVFADEVREGMVYTRAYDGPIANFDNSHHQPGTGKVFVETPNIPYWYDPNPANPLFVIPTASEAYSGQRVISIDPAKYPVGYGVCILSNSTAKTTSTGTSPTGSKSGAISAGLLASTATATFSNAASTSLAGNPTASIVGSVSADRATSGGTTTTTPDGTVVYLKKSLDSILDDILNGVIDPGPSCIRREFQSATRPDRIFVRAEVRNQPAPDSSAFCTDNPLDEIPPCVRRTAYTNPVWLKIEPCTSLISCVTSGIVAGVTDVLTTDPGSAGSTGTGGTTTPTGGTTVNDALSATGTRTTTTDATTSPTGPSTTGTTTAIKGTTSLSSTRTSMTLR